MTEKESVSFVLDCSVSISWCFSDEWTEYSEGVLHIFSKGYTALVPAIWKLETMNVLWQAERRGRLPAAAVEHFLVLFESLPINVQGESGIHLDRELISLSRHYGLALYDASYLSLALKSALPLATKDGSLIKACEQAGVPLFIA